MFPNSHLLNNTKQFLLLKKMFLHKPHSLPNYRAQRFAHDPCNAEHALGTFTSIVHRKEV